MVNYFQNLKIFREHGDIFVRNNESLTIINKIDKKFTLYG